ncbi:MAG TPA: bifunctional phosphopantothenoylcysteine decarboxylase/phosphopantothenate--cysteine ligase CoaBC [Gammaproteobacteria bacterium]|nr:bifunctional phosphopantothenoylcysteine decarboxylase/phosphopantothenate--cysteine ligase CoaBC [Gammaproteobacteria bacterium]
MNPIPTRIVLGVSGGIAAYKSPDLVRRLRERGAEVRVVMTRGATEFVTPMTFQAVSGHVTRTDVWDQAAEQAMSHIELARWADHVLIAPASADVMARLAHGQADDLLTTLCLASQAPLTLAPAMNQVMWRHPATQANCKVLISRGVQLLGPADGELAEGESGPGRMLEPLEIAEALLGQASRPLAGKQVLLTAGPTREAVDPVRFISNRSSGKMGFAMARAAAVAGAQVTLIAGPVHLPTPAGVTRIDVETAAQMYDATMQHAAQADIFIATAAVADYAPAKPAITKIKKQDAHMELPLQRTQDILAAVAAGKPKPFTVGFAAETENLEAHARKKLSGKKLDMVAANLVGGGRAFDVDDNELHVFWTGGETKLAPTDKDSLARALITLIVERINKS